MAMIMNRKYMAYYFDGRDDALETDEVDVDALAAKCLAGPDDVHTVLLAEMTTMAAPITSGIEKREWLADAKAVIAEEGLDPEEAYRHFCKGRIDEAVWALEEEVLELMDPREEDVVEDDDDDDEDEDGDDDEGEEE